MAGFVRKVLKSGLGIFTSRVLGMVRDVLVAGFYGVNAVTDAFFVAFAIPNLFRAFFAEGALSSVFVPVMSDKITRQGGREASRYLTSLILGVSLMVIIILVVVFMFPEYIVSVFMPGYRNDPSILIPAAKMLKILMPYLLFISICALLSGYLNIKNSYFIPASSTALLNIAMIIGAWIGFRHSGDIYFLCYGVFFGGLLQLAGVLIFAVIKGYRPVFSGGLDPEAKKTFHLVLPSLASVGINQLNFMVGRVIASYLTVGSITYLYYANRLFQFPLGMFAVAVGTVTLTEISVSNSKGEYEQRDMLINKAINSIFAIMIPAAAGLIILAWPIINMIYGRMSFGSSDVASTAFALQMYSAGLLFYSLISVFSRLYYSDNDVKTPLRGAFFSFVLNIALCFVFMKPLGHAGIALASSVSALFNSVYLYANIKKYSYPIRRDLFFVLKVAASASVMGIAVYYAGAMGLNVIANIALGCFVYFGIMYMFRVNLLRVTR